MPTINEAITTLEAIAPLALAEDWDNVGLLLGDREALAAKIMTCLTITPDSVAEAIADEADLIVSHHPLPFRPLNSITTATNEGNLLWQLAKAGIAIYSPHTAFDSAAIGINQQLAEGVGMKPIAPLTPDTDDPSVGSGRHGVVVSGTTVESLAAQLKSQLSLPAVRVVAKDVQQTITRVAFGCGSGGSFLDAARTAGCDALVTGEATFHNCLAAEAAGIALLLVGHYASERFALEWLAEELATRLPDAQCWASVREHDPLQTV